MPLLLVRNAERGPTIWAKPGKDTVVWGPAGTPEEIRRVSDAMLEDPDFLESVDNGTLVLEEAGEDVDARMREFSDWRRQQREQRERDSEAVMDRRHRRDIVGEACVGPGPNGRAYACGAVVNRVAGEKDQTPPLCGRHRGLVNEYALDRSGSAGDDRDPLRSQWVRVDLG